MDSVIWKEVPECPGYWLSSDGRLQNRSETGTKNILYPRLYSEEKNRGAQFRIKRKKVFRAVTAFKLLAITFLDASWDEKKILIIPKDGNWDNITSENVLIFRGKELEEYYQNRSRNNINEVLRTKGKVIGVLPGPCPKSIPVIGTCVKTHKQIRFPSMSRANKYGFVAGCISTSVRYGGLHKGYVWQIDKEALEKKRKLKTRLQQEIKGAPHAR